MSNVTRVCGGRGARGSEGREAEHRADSAKDADAVDRVGVGRKHGQRLSLPSAPRALAPG